MVLIYSGRYHPQPLVSSLLEELLHVRLYVTAWQHRGYIHPLDRHGVDKDLFVQCTRFHDEHMVARWKAAICSTTRLFDSEYGLDVGYLWYGESLRSMLEEAGSSLAEVISDAASHRLGAEDAWSWIADLVYRGVFEPLAREAGFRAGNPSSQLGPYNSPAESRFYRRHVEPHWRATRYQLDRSFGTDLAEMDEALVELMNIVTQFLARIGVTYQTNSDRGNRFSFDPRPLARSRRV